MPILVVIELLEPFNATWIDRMDDSVDHLESRLIEV